MCGVLARFSTERDVWLPRAGRSESGAQGRSPAGGPHRGGWTDGCLEALQPAICVVSICVVSKKNNEATWWLSGRALRLSCSCGQYRPPQPRRRIKAVGRRPSQAKANTMHRFVHQRVKSVHQHNRERSKYAHQYASSSSGPGRDPARPPFGVTGRAYRPGGAAWPRTTEEKRGASWKVEILRDRAWMLRRVTGRKCRHASYQGKN